MMPRAADQMANSPNQHGKAHAGHPGSAVSMSSSLIIEVSEIVVHEADEPNSVVGLFDIDGPGALNALVTGDSG
jgi:hypothetical protein